MSAFVSQLIRLRDAYAAEEGELKGRTPSDGKRLSEIQALRAACDLLIKAQEVGQRDGKTIDDESLQEESIREVVLEVLTAKQGLGYRPLDMYEVVVEKLPWTTLMQIETALKKLVDEGGPIKYGEGHYYS